MTDLLRRQTTGTPRWVRVFWVGVVLFLLAFAALHLSGHGLGHHGGMP